MVPWDLPCCGLDLACNTFVIDGKLHGVNYFEESFALLSIQSNVDGTGFNNIQGWVVSCIRNLTAR
ncbi:hypothetical protein HID58_085005 [Brassica napus]|uniref:Uncharacterized protein n=1 Tax=Brassica napus TaxID=3708 RepID=A0ABQ7XLD5_BRANA|nr:hypothetical protein HID58_085005 [Brassica napus]